MKEAWAASKRQSLKKWTWRADAVTFDPRSEPSFSRAANEALLADSKATSAKRGNAAFQDRLLSAMRYEFGGHLEKPANTDASNASKGRGR